MKIEKGDERKDPLPLLYIHFCRVSQKVEKCLKKVTVEKLLIALSFGFILEMLKCVFVWIFSSPFMRLVVESVGMGWRFGGRTRRRRRKREAVVAGGGATDMK